MSVLVSPTLPFRNFLRFKHPPRSPMTVILSGSLSSHILSLMPRFSPHTSLNHLSSLPTPACHISSLSSSIFRPSYRTFIPFPAIRYQCVFSHPLSVVIPSLSFLWLYYFFQYLRPFILFYHLDLAKDPFHPRISKISFPFLRCLIRTSIFPLRCLLHSHIHPPFSSPSR